MTECARCGSDEAESRAGAGYEYCDDCWELIERVRDEGVYIRSRHFNNEFHRDPYNVPANNQVEALAYGLDQMEERGCEGVFHYQKTGSYWLISEYLEAHPGIREDVQAERADPGRGLLGRILG